MSYVVYTARDELGVALYVGMTRDLERRLAEHARHSAWFSGTIGIATEAFPDSATAHEAEARTIREVRPRFNTYLTGERTRRPQVPDRTVAVGAFNSRVAEEIRATLARRGMGKKDLCRILGVSQPTGAGRWYGRSPYRVDDLDRIAVALGMPVASLVDFTA